MQVPFALDLVQRVVPALGSWGEGPFAPTVIRLTGPRPVKLNSNQSWSVRAHNPSPQLPNEFGTSA